MAKRLDAEGATLKEIVTSMQKNVGRWVMAVENPITSPPTVEVYLGEKDQDFSEFHQELSHIPDEWEPLDAALVFKLMQNPPTIELTEDLLALAPENIRPDVLERHERRRLLEDIVESMTTKQGLQLRRTTPPIKLI